VIAVGAEGVQLVICAEAQRPPCLVRCSLPATGVTAKVAFPDLAAAQIPANLFELLPQFRQPLGKAVQDLVAHRRLAIRRSTGRAREMYAMASLCTSPEGVFGQGAGTVTVMGSVSVTVARAVVVSTTVSRCVEVTTRESVTRRATVTVLGAAAGWLR
jgi:hypothetical protein